ncbi:MAG: hypothetical protein FJ410_05710 [Verrucomicrobia bacterium]|nr:hypothetical protein [Verrucomicrobiota bacterium]
MPVLRDGVAQGRGASPWAPSHWTGLIGPGATVKLAVAAVMPLPVLLNGLSWRLWLGTYYGFLPEQPPSGGRRADD